MKIEYVKIPNIIPKNEHKANGSTLFAWVIPRKYVIKYGTPSKWPLTMRHVIKSRKVVVWYVMSWICAVVQVVEETKLWREENVLIILTVVVLNCTF